MSNPCLELAPGGDPLHGNAARGVKGIVLEAFGAGNMPDNPEHYWLPWLKQQRQAGVQARAST